MTVFRIPQLHQPTLFPFVPTYLPPIEILVTWTVGTEPLLEEALKFVPHILRR